MSEKKVTDFPAGISHIPDALLLAWTTRISAGERNVEVDRIARALIRDICLRQWLGVPHSAIALNWLCDVLDGTLNHEDPKSLLGLLPRKASRPASSVDTSFEVACWLRLAQEDRGYTRREAKDLAAQLFGRDLKTIERDARMAKSWVSTINPDADWEGRFLTMKPPRPLPPRRSGKSRVPVPTRAK
mgnify:FL=1